MSARCARRRCTTRRRWPRTMRRCSASSKRRLARSPTTWPGRGAGCRNWATAPACSTRCGMPAPSASGCSPAGSARASAWASWPRPNGRWNEHLQSHLERLPAADHASRAIVQRMMEDEARHAADARAAGAVELPGPGEAGDAPGRQADDPNRPPCLNLELCRSARRRDAEPRCTRRRGLAALLVAGSGPGRGLHQPAQFVALQRDRDCRARRCSASSSGATWSPRTPTP